MTSLDFEKLMEEKNGNKSNYFSLSLDSLRALGSWATDRAERSLPVFESFAESDTRPRDAIEGIRLFAGGGKRTRAGGSARNPAAHARP